MLVDGIAKQTCVQKNWKKKKKRLLPKSMSLCHMSRNTKDQ